MNFPTCVITGCFFYSPLEHRYVRGDLHRIGDCYILNANTVAGGNCDWNYGGAPVNDMVVCALQSAYFERRGVVVFTTAVASFNDHAEQYLRESPHYVKP